MNFGKSVPVISDIKEDSRRKTLSLYGKKTRIRFSIAKCGGKLALGLFSLF